MSIFYYSQYWDPFIMIDVCLICFLHKAQQQHRYSTVDHIRRLGRHAGSCVWWGQSVNVSQSTNTTNSTSVIHLSLKWPYFKDSMNYYWPKLLSRFTLFSTLISIWCTLFFYQNVITFSTSEMIFFSPVLSRSLIFNLTTCFYSYMKHFLDSLTTLGINIMGCMVIFQYHGIIWSRNSWRYPLT